MLEDTAHCFALEDMLGMQVVWFKRDLRIEDHSVLVEASKHGPILFLYILEPKLWQQPDLSFRHYQFLMECLSELNQALQKHGHHLVIKVGCAINVLAEIHRRHKIKILWSHQETWNGWTYSRDKEVKIWTKANNILWHELVQNGVIRCLSQRDGWAARWYAQMKKPILPFPRKLSTVHESSDELPSATKIGLIDDRCLLRQKGGRDEGLKLLDSFLYSRGESYTRDMSSPVTAFGSCSRLSAHLAFGTLSMREVFSATEQRSYEIKMMPPGTREKWPSAIRSFSGRLRWHCHFIQKLEDEPHIEFENMHSAFNSLRENDFNDEYFQAWKTGLTGYPMIDACMRALTTTGWLNFRMRAMLASFASNHLWLHWRKPSLHLARLFTDYEPGIHYSQMQMQSGTTGINSIRIYNPIKQGIDHDPQGVFIRRWIPELADMPPAFIHTPWNHASRLNGYPTPIVNEKLMRTIAAEKLYGLRDQDDYYFEAKQIVARHGSRKSAVSRKHPRNQSNKVTEFQQLELPL